MSLTPTTYPNICVACHIDINLTTRNLEVYSCDCHFNHNNHDHDHASTSCLDVRKAIVLIRKGIPPFMRTWSGEYNATSQPATADCIQGRLYRSHGSLVRLPAEPFGWWLLARWHFTPQECCAGTTRSQPHSFRPAWSASLWLACIDLISFIDHEMCRAGMRKLMTSMRRILIDSEDRSVGKRADHTWTLYPFTDRGWSWTVLAIESRCQHGPWMQTRTMSTSRLRSPWVKRVMVDGDSIHHHHHHQLSAIL